MFCHLCIMSLDSPSGHSTSLNAICVVKDITGDSLLTHLPTTLCRPAPSAVVHNLLLQSFLVTLASRVNLMLRPEAVFPPCALPTPIPGGIALAKTFPSSNIYSNNCPVLLCLCLPFSSTLKLLHYLNVIIIVLPFCSANIHHSPSTHTVSWRKTVS